MGGVLLQHRTLLVAPGIATSNNGIATALVTSSEDIAMRQLGNFLFESLRVQV